MVRVTSGVLAIATRPGGVRRVISNGVLNDGSSNEGNIRRA